MPSFSIEKMVVFIHVIKMLRRFLSIGSKILTFFFIRKHTCRKLSFLICILEETQKCQKFACYFMNIWLNKTIGLWNSDYKYLINYSVSGHKIIKLCKLQVSSVTTQNKHAGLWCGFFFIRYIINRVFFYMWESKIFRKITLLWFFINWFI